MINPTTIIVFIHIFLKMNPARRMMQIVIVLYLFDLYTNMCMECWIWMIPFQSTRLWPSMLYLKPQSHSIQNLSTTWKRPKIGANHETDVRASHVGFAGFWGFIEVVLPKIIGRGSWRDLRYASQFSPRPVADRDWRTRVVLVVRHSHGDFAGCASLLSIWVFV